MARVYNFSAGPAVLPEDVLREAAAEMLDYRGSGMSVNEMSHRSATFQEIIDTAESEKYRRTVSTRCPYRSNRGKRQWQIVARTR